MWVPLRKRMAALPASPDEQSVLLGRQSPTPPASELHAEADPEVGAASAEEPLPPAAGPALH